MPDQSRDVSPGPDRRSVRTAVGQLLRVPRHWVLVPPGDPALTRRIKKAGPTWSMKEKRGRRTVSRGVWADRSSVEAIRAALVVARADPAYARRLEAGKRRRDATQVQYAGNFEAAVAAFLAFTPPHEELGRALSVAITRHSVPVGAGTVARTKRISIERRAEAATIAWLRHQTTGYDDMRIPNQRGMRREVRRMLAERSRQLLRRYRSGESLDGERCPLRAALTQLDATPSEPRRPSA